MTNQQLDEQSHKLINKKFEKRKVYSYFKDNIWGAELANMQLAITYNKAFRFSIMCYCYL